MLEVGCWMLEFDRLARPLWQLRKRRRFLEARARGHRDYHRAQP